MSMDAAAREFFRTVRNASFSNPFGDRRPVLDRVAAGVFGEVQESEVLTQLIEKVGRTIAEVERRPGSLSGEDSELLRYGRLFYTFHLFCTAYDEHIRKQVERGDEPCRVPFARDVLAMLAGQGFGSEECRYFLALFFQMRRAFFFIRAIAGRSRCVMELRRALWNNVFTGDVVLYDTYLRGRMEDFSTMILGETGTGKGMAAAAIGRSGFIPFDEARGTFAESFARAFLSINLSQYPEQLIESELFGHKKGAFTGAVDNHRGVFSRCSPCGAIFLDEIGDVQVPVQIKLLQVLQARSFTPVGSHAVERFQGRVIAATNRDIGKLRAEGSFRDDFYYRLCSDLIEVPPLRQRIRENPGELQDLLGVVVERIIGRSSDDLAAQLHQRVTASQPENYAWPGNIRELEQCVRRMLLSSRYDWQRPAAGDGAARLVERISMGNLTARQLLEQYSRILYARENTYEGVARIMDLDRRTVKKYIRAEED